MKILSKAVKSQVNLVGAPSFAQVNPYGLYDHFKSDEYASHYPNVRPITNELMGINPYAIDANGKPVEHAAVNALFHPNQLDSFQMFIEKVGVSVLAQDYTYLLVWRLEDGESKPGGNFGFKGQKIAGYTFLENPGIEYRDGKYYYKMGAQEFTQDEVIAIPGGAKPGSLYKGYSPALSAAKWATLDGHIADFQNGFFENNAIPAGVFQVVAGSDQDYRDMVATLQRRHRGAGKNNNVSYSHVPLDATGKPQQAQITWVPFSQSNKDIDFKPLLEHVDNRLSESYGVSSIIKGVDSAAKYSNAEVSEASFAKRAVKPLALRIYSQITHELNRITGGLGVAITFKYEIPAVSDALKVRAETKQIESEIILKYTSDPYNWSLDSVVEAFQLSNSYKLLKKGDAPAVIDNDKPEVDEGDEVDKSPDPNKIDGITPLNEAAKRKNPKAELTDLEKLEAATRSYMKSQVDRAVSEYRDEVSDAVQPEADDTELEAFVVAMLAVITAILIARGETQYAAGTTLLKNAGESVENLQEFILSDDTTASYRSYLRRVGESYGSDTAQSIRNVLASSEELGLSRAETEKALRNIMNTDEWRVKRVGVTELNRSQGIGSVESMKQIQNETGAVLEKSLSHPQGAECEFCKALEGQWVKVDQPLVGLDQSITGVDGGILINDFVQNDGYDPHPNGKGVMVYRVANKV